MEVGVSVKYAPATDPLTGEVLDRSYHFSFWINRAETDEPNYCSPAPYPRILLGRPISKQEFEFLIADRRWAKAYEPESPEADPTKPVDLSTLPLPF